MTRFFSAIFLIFAMLVSISAWTEVDEIPLVIPSGISIENDKHLSEQQQYSIFIVAKGQAVDLTATKEDLEELGIDKEYCTVYLYAKGINRDRIIQNFLNPSQGPVTLVNQNKMEMPYLNFDVQLSGEESKLYMVCQGYDGTGSVENYVQSIWTQPAD